MPCHAKLQFMTLAQYLEQHAMTAQRFAASAGIDPGTVSRLLTGQVPRADTALKIHDITGGAVTLEDWRKP